MKIGPGVSELWGVENRLLPLTRPMAYTTACTTVQAVILRSHTRTVVRECFKSQRSKSMEKAEIRPLATPIPLFVTENRFNTGMLKYKLSIIVMVAA